MTPVIGITCYLERARWGTWDRRVALLPDAYVARVQDAGAHAVLLPPDPASGADLVGRLDGLLLAGGPDVDPARYGAAAHPLTVCHPERDAGEFAVLAAALELDLPVLGVCRGAEVLAVHYGGTLHQHLPDLLGGDRRHQPGDGVYGRHTARFARGSLVADVYGEHAEINSYHHQAVDDPGGLIVTGRSDDVLVEAVEDPARRFVLGLQWHPEQDGDVRPFSALVTAARS